MCNKAVSDEIPKSTGKNDPVRTRNARNARNVFSQHLKDVHPVTIDTSLCYPELTIEEVNKFYDGEECSICKLVIGVHIRYSPSIKRDHLLDKHQIKVYGGCKICNLVFKNNSKGRHFDGTNICKIMRQQIKDIEPIQRIKSVRKPKNINKYLVKLGHCKYCGLTYYNEGCKNEHERKNKCEGCKTATRFNLIRI